MPVTETKPLPITERDREQFGLAAEVRRLRDLLVFADGLAVAYTGFGLANLYAADCTWAQTTLRDAGCHPRDPDYEYRNV